MKILVIDNETTTLWKIVTLFQESEIDIVSLWYDFDKLYYDLYILSGSSHHSIFYQPSPYTKELEFITSTEKPIIGICLGAQLIAQAFNSSIEKLPTKNRGVQILVYNMKEYSVFKSHKYITKELWEDLLSVVQSEHGHEIFRHREKNIRWLQFHPEVSIEGNSGRQLLYDLMKDTYLDKVFL